MMQCPQIFIQIQYINNVIVGKPRVSLQQISCTDGLTCHTVSVWCMFVIASYPGLLTPAFVTCSTNFSPQLLSLAVLMLVSTASDKCWDKKAWVRGYIRYAYHNRINSLKECMLC